MARHLVFGAGLIGCYLGASIRHAGIDVSLYCRPNVAEKLSKGITLTDFLEHRVFVPSIDVLTFPTQRDDIDVVWLTVKCTGVLSALDDLRKFIGERTLIICCQNGLGSDAPVREAFPEATVIRAMVPFNVVELSSGHYHRGSEGALSIERIAGDGRVDDIVSLINCDILPLVHCDDMDSLLWAKLQLNLGNSVNALANVPVKSMLEKRKFRRVIALLMSELLVVTHAKQIVLPKVTSVPGRWIPWVLRLPDVLFTRVANKMLAIDPEVKTSMWWDIHLERKTEIDFLNGAIVNAADALGIDCPANKRIIELVKQLEGNFGKTARKDILAEELWDIINLD